MITKARAFLGWPLYILFKSDGRHRMHCLVFTDTNLYSLTKGKSYLAYQRWRRSTCSRDICYDVGCHLCYMIKSKNKTNMPVDILIHLIFSFQSKWLILQYTISQVPLLSVQSKVSSHFRPLRVLKNSSENVDCFLNWDVFCWNNNITHVDAKHIHQGFFLYLKNGVCYRGQLGLWKVLWYKMNIYLLS